MSAVSFFFAVGLRNWIVGFTLLFRKMDLIRKSVCSLVTFFNLWKCSFNFHYKSLTFFRWTLLQIWNFHDIIFDFYQGLLIFNVISFGFWYKLFNSNKNESFLILLWNLKFQRFSSKTFSIFCYEFLSDYVYENFHTSNPGIFLHLPLEFFNRTNFTSSFSLSFGWKCSTISILLTVS